MGGSCGNSDSVKGMNTERVANRNQKGSRMSLFRALCIAFSIYSKIPVPQFEWKDKDMRYQLIFFPWVGAVIGVLLSLWGMVSQSFAVGTVAYALVGAAIPLLVTGGFHVDGFMDTMDAIHSYKTREEKLDILKDPHVGAFAVIMLVLYGLLYIAAFSEMDVEVLYVFASGFFLSRTLSGIAMVSFPAAKKEGMLYAFVSAMQGSERRTVRIVLLLELALCGGFMLWRNLILGGCLLAAALLVFWYYWYRTKKEFGGVTGDTAGCFVTVAEGAMAVIAAVYSGIIG